MGGGNNNIAVATNNIAKDGTALAGAGIVRKSDGNKATATNNLAVAGITNAVMVLS